MSIILEKINTKITTLKNNFEVNKNVEHNGIKGGLNEGEFSDLIKEIIPTKYRVIKGIIENASGDQSKEVDALIYDDEVLPAYIKRDFTFVPVEAVKYYFEVKSVLNSKELNTTITKFNHYFQTIGGRSPTVLFSFSTDINGSELMRYYKNDENFFINPAIRVLCVSNKGYYYKDSTEHYLKDFLSIKDVIKQFLICKNQNPNDVEPYMKDVKALKINGIEYDKIKFKIHKWMGVECCNNNIELAFLSGVSNTLSKGSFGKYLLSKNEADFKVFAVCYEDMWGNQSCQDFNEKGLSYNPNVCGFTYEVNDEVHKIVFKVN